MTREDVLSYLDKSRKPEDEDPLHKWIGSYNIRCVILFRFSNGCIILISPVLRKEMNYLHKKT